ncbi:MAG TPA: hypothetical protein VGQ36_06070 [Thermoanaerobaculia bacterium]|jgi:hypothetical protein|nr:hypothetical protein [Thermoanaerobaculia bacterium]
MMNDGMLTNPSEEIAQYSRHCERLLHDVNAVLEDYEEHDKLDYAVDFSEIYAFVLPEDSHESAPFDDGWAGDHLRQALLLSNFFSRRGIVLPEPYILELYTFYDRVAVGTFGDETALVVDAIRDLERLRKAGITKHIEELAAKADRTGLTSEEIDETIEFFEQRGSLLISFARGADRTPLLRLKQLFKSQPFVDLETAVPEATAEIDEGVVNDLYRRLKIKRKTGTPASSKVDALAIDHIRAANRVLQPKKRRLLLVTRSPHMFSALSDVTNDPAWVGIKPFIRHPRTFSAAYDLPQSADRDTFIRRVRVRKEMLELFIHSATEARQTGGITPARYAALKEKMKEIQEEWSSAETLSNALEKKRETSKGELASLAHRLLSFLRGRTLLQTAKERIVELFEETSRDIGLVGARMQTPEVTLGSVLYPIELVDERLRNTIARLASQWAINAGEAASLFDEAAAREALDDHEFLLTIAISLGGIGRWSVAEQYAAYAVKLAGDAGKPTAEARFFHALASRKLFQPTKLAEENRLYIVTGLQEMELALQERPDDARYLNESAILRGHELPAIENAKKRRKQRAKIAAIFERALSLPHTDKLEVQILNNLAYMHYTVDPPDYDIAHKYLDALETKLESQPEPRDRWPSFALDTLLYGRFCLRGSSIDLATLEPSVNELTQVAGRSDLSRAEQGLVGQHVKIMARKLTELTQPAPSPDRPRARRQRHKAAESRD